MNERKIISIIPAPDIEYIHTNDLDEARARAAQRAEREKARAA